MVASPPVSAATSLEEQLMKKNYAITAATFALVAAITGCNSPSAGPTQESQSPSVESSPTVMASPSVEISPSSPSSFDPNNPEGWEAEGDEWYKELGTTEEDLGIGNFTLGMAFEEAASYFPSDPLSDTKTAGGLLTERTLTFDSLVLVFVEDENEPPVSLYSIEVNGPGYTTPRGLQVGNDANKLVALYGTPWYVQNQKWIFIDIYGGYTNFSATVADGLVKSIKVNQSM